MSEGLEVKKPIRFFFFFGLFLAFVLLGVRACNDRQTQQEVAEVEKILNDNKRDLIPSQDKSGYGSSQSNLSIDEKIRNAKKNLIDSNSNELGAFEASKKEIVEKAKNLEVQAKNSLGKKTTLKVTKDTSRAVINVRPKKEKAEQPKAVVAKKAEKKVEKKVESANVAEKKTEVSGSAKMKILVTGKGYTLDPISQAKLKGAVRLNTKPNRVKVLIFSNDSQGRSAVVKRAELKSALIRAGLSTTTQIDFQSVDRSGYAEILFY